MVVYYRYTDKNNINKPKEGEQTNSEKHWIKKMENDLPGFICLNFANPDMVGHTGNPDAIVKACETVDACLKKVVEKGKSEGYSFIIIADHGNADNMLNKDGSPNTAHSVNLVPLIVIDKNINQINNGILADIAPTILELLEIEK